MLPKQTSPENQIYCTDSQEIADAHAVGLSFGKYRAFLAAQAVNPELTVEDAQELTMRELEPLLEALKMTAPPDRNGSRETAAKDPGTGMRPEPTAIRKMGKGISTEKQAHPVLETGDSRKDGPSPCYSSPRTLQKIRTPPGCCCP